MFFHTEPFGKQTVLTVPKKLSATLSVTIGCSERIFGICDPGATSCVTTDSGTAVVEGATITWVRDTTLGTITLNIVSEDGTTTTISVPIEGFGF